MDKEPELSDIAGKDQLIDAHKRRLAKIDEETKPSESIDTETITPADEAYEIASEYPEQYRSMPVLLDVVIPKDLLGKQIISMRGVFYVFEQAGGISFIPEGGQHGMQPVLNVNNRLMPLIKSLAVRRTVVQLRGISDDNSFSACEILAAATRYVGHFEFNDLQLQEVLARLLTSPIVETESAKETAALPAFNTLEELDQFYKVCRGTFTAPIRQWVENNLEQSSLSHTAKDEKRHIQRALSYVLSIDWGARPPGPDINNAAKLLNTEFYGLDVVKKRIIETVAQIRRSGTLPKWGILLNGPPGIGKTSIANVVGRILDMPVVTVDMSVITDAMALTGSSRIYENAMPGILFRSLYEARSANVVMVINEIDKASRGYRNYDPSDVLLPLLDGYGFTDTFIEARIPTDNMFFIATCNDVEKISRPILDRFLRIDIPGYTAAEKEAIMLKHTVPKILSHMNVTAEEFELAPEAVSLLLNAYATDPGVRDMEKLIERLVADYLYQVEMRGIRSYRCETTDIKRLFGQPQVRERHFSIFPGLVSTAFYYNGQTQIFPVEATVSKGTGEFDVINIQSDTQEGNCRAAYECARRVSDIDFSTVDVCIFVPQQLPPIAGNFLGSAVCTAILSACNNLCISKDTLFLGGCDLYGNMYYDETTVDQLLVKAQEKGYKTVFAPVGTSARVSHSLENISLQIIEGESITDLYEIATGAYAKWNSI